MSDAAAREQNDTEAGPSGPGLRVPFSAAPAAARLAARRRLAALLAAKLTLDLLFVCGLTLYTQAFTSRTNFEGALEHADGRGARGWVLDLERPGAPVEVQVFENGRLLAAGVADEPRPDASAGAHPEGVRRGFTVVFDVELDGGHEVRVYAVRAGRGGARRTLRRIGEPVWLGRK